MQQEAGQVEGQEHLPSSQGCGAGTKISRAGGHPQSRRRASSWNIREPSPGHAATRCEPGWDVRQTHTTGQRGRKDPRWRTLRISLFSHHHHHHRSKRGPTLGVDGKRRIRGETFREKRLIVVIRVVVIGPRRPIEGRQLQLFPGNYSLNPS